MEFAAHLTARRAAHCSSALGFVNEHADYQRASDLQLELRSSQPEDGSQPDSQGPAFQSLLSIQLAGLGQKEKKYVEPSR